MIYSKHDIESKLNLKSVSTDEIDTWIKAEFESCYKKFKRNMFSWRQIQEYKGEVLNGVYIFHIPDMIWKIGKHQVDAVVRAKQHVIDNTGAKQNSDFSMGLVPIYSEVCSVIIYSPEKKEDIHWIIALEAFLELKARKEKSLIINSARIG